MKSEKIGHSMREVVTALEAKITDLENARAQVEDRVRKGHELAINTTALTQINDSLCAARGARKMMMDSCCTTYNCEFNWAP